MMLFEKDQNDERRMLIQKFRQFLGAGALGFIIDAAVFFWLSQFAGIHHRWARIAASFVALTATWIMNREHAFAACRSDAAFVEYLRYLVASSAGAGANLIVLSLIAQYSTSLHQIPGYISGALAGLIVNFLLYDRFVFQKRVKIAPDHPTPSENVQ